jgi:hypothetical protein
MEGKVFESKRKRGGPRIRVVEWFSNGGRVVDADTGLKPRWVTLGTIRENYREVTP